jgi:1,4-dihydroxy-2-naphthoate octaprenyltransferase
MLLALTIGFFMVIYFKTGTWTFPLGIIGILAGFFYTAKPIQLAYRGLGEIFIGFSYGWMPVLTGYYLQSGKFDLLPALISFPIAFSIFEVIFINEFPDYQSDKTSNKNNLVVKMGLEKSALVYNLLLVLTFLSIIPAFFFRLPLMAVVFLAFPFALGMWNFIEVARGEWRDKERLEGICARTIGINLLITISLIITFLWKGLT